MKTIKLKSGTELPLMNIKGRDYLQVAYRLVWMREEHKDWAIETDVTRQKDETWARAVIKNESGRILATAHKFENAQGFGDHAEKAETGAIGRALALCGYGTQFEPELDEGDRLADSLVGGSQGIHPENPDIGDGFRADVGYRVPFGKWGGRSLEEIPLEGLRSYIIYIEDKAKKDNKPLQGNVLDFINRASNHIAALENNYDPGFDQ